jgi:hypothetical protein
MDSPGGVDLAWASVREWPPSFSLSGRDGDGKSRSTNSPFASAMATDRSHGSSMPTYT